MSTKVNFVDYIPARRNNGSFTAIGLSLVSVSPNGQNNQGNQRQNANPESYWVHQVPMGALSEELQNQIKEEIENAVTMGRTYPIFPVNQNQIPPPNSFLGMARAKYMEEHGNKAVARPVANVTQPSEEEVPF